MGVSSLIIAVFIAASLGLSWISGDKEQERLNDRVAQRGVETKDVERELGNKNRQFTRQNKELAKIKMKLKQELRAKKKVERKLAYEKRQRRMAKEQQGNVVAGEKVENKNKENEAIDRKKSKSVSSNVAKVDREKIRAEIEGKVKQEISELEAKLKAVEESSKRLEVEMQLRVEEEARKRAEEAWTQAELARVRAEEAATESQKLKARLDKVMKAKQALDIALSEQEDALIRAEERLEKERMEREKLEEKLNDASKAFDTSKAQGAEAIEGASTALKAAEEATSVAQTPEVVARMAQKIARLDTARAEAQKELSAKSQEISLLKSRISEIEAEKEIISGEAFDSANRLVALKQQLEETRLTESELRDTLGEQKATHKAELETAFLEKEQSLKAVHDAAMIELEEKLNTASLRLSENVEKVPALMAELESAGVKEAELLLAIEKQKGEYAAEKNRALGEQKLELQKSYESVSAELEARLAEVSAEKEKNALAASALQAEVESATLKEVELSAALEEQKTVHAIELERALAEQQMSLKQSFNVRIVELESKFADASIAKVVAGEAVDEETARLRERATELEIQNRELNAMLRESKIRLAEADIERDTVKELIAKNAALEAKLKEAGLANLQGKAADFVAQKLIERNADLEAKLQEARLGLAKSEAARERAEELTEQNNALVSKLKNAEVSLAAVKGSSEVVAQITSRNAELEEKIVEAEAAIAQADAARFMVEELNRENLELSEMLERERAAGSDGSELEVKLRNVNDAIELKLKEERGVRTNLESKLVEAMEAKSAGETAISDLVKLQSSTEQALQRELEEKKILEESLAQTELKLSLSEESAREAVKAMSEAEALLLNVRKEQQGDSASIVERGAAISTDVLSALDAANQARVDLETQLGTQMEAGRIVEAKLREFEQTVGQQNITIKSLEQAVIDAESRLESKVSAKDEIKADIRSVGAKARTMGAEGGSDVTLFALQSEFTQLKGKITRKLKSGEIEASDLLEMMTVDGVLNVYVVNKGDTLWRIASNKDHYANPFMWPLIYRYNVTKLRSPDRLEPGQVLIIFKEVSETEAVDAVKKAKNRGNWRKWSSEQKKDWVKEWSLH